MSYIGNSDPGWRYGFIPSAVEWNAEWALKQDYDPSLTALVNLGVSRLIGNANGTVGGIAIGTGLLLSATGTLSATGILSLVAGAGISISGGNTIANSGIVSLVGGTNVSISGGNTIAAATSVVAGSGISISGGNTVANTGIVSLVAGIGISVSGSTVSATGNGGQVTLNATAAATITVTPTLGIENYKINGAAAGGTIPAIVLGVGSQLGQKMVLNISNGATGMSWPATFTGANYSTDLPAPTVTTTAGKRGTFIFILNVGTTVWDLEAINQGFSP